MGGQGVTEWPATAALLRQLGADTSLGVEPRTIYAHRRAGPVLDSSFSCARPDVNFTFNVTQFVSRSWSLLLRWPPTRHLVFRIAGSKERAAAAPWLITQRFREGIYNVGYRLAGAADGYPFPPARMVYTVIANWQLGWYQLGGMFMHQSIVALLWKHQANPDSLQSILDFGCGCGRILRHWPPAQHELWGSDYNPTLVDWCRRRLGRFAQFSVNGSEPPLGFAADKFEFVYAYSVFTHLSHIQQRPWIVELSRVLKPGGFLLFTVHGPSAATRHGRSVNEELAEKGILIFSEELAGTNACAVYHHERYVKEELCRDLELVEYVPRGAIDASGLDVYLFRKPLTANTDGCSGRKTSDGGRP